MFFVRVATLICVFAASSLNAAEMDGVYYCTGKAAAGVDNGVGKSFAPYNRFTAKVSSKTKTVTLSGDANFSFDLIGNNREKGWVYATSGVYYIFTMYDNSKGAFDYTLNLSRINETTYKLEALFVEMGSCQSW